MKIDFNYRKPYITPEGDIITMKSLITMLGIQSIECHENKNTYLVISLIPV